MDTRKQHEEAVEEQPRPAGARQRHELETELERYRRLFHGSPLGMVRESALGEVLEVNEAFLALIGHDDPKSVVHRSMEELYVDPADATRSRSTLLREGACAPREVRLHREKGDPVWVQESSVLLPTPEPAGTEILRTLFDVHDRRERERNLERMAYRDPLTGLANRRMLGIRADQTLALADRQGIRAALVYLDLVDFKEVNDAHGHATGDALLVHVGHCVENALRSSDTVARVGGDEFAILLSEAENSGAARRTAERLLQALRAPHRADGCDIVVEARAGVAVFPDDGRDFESLLTVADEALIRAKSGAGDVILAETRG